MIILDTNIISELMREKPNPAVWTWADKVNPRDMYLTAITVAELRYGVDMLPAGNRRTRLDEIITETIDDAYEDRIFPFDHNAALAYGALAAMLRRNGNVVDKNDAMIAAIALQYDIPVVTRNAKHFIPCGLDVINPFEE